MATKQPPPSASTSGAAVSMKDYLKRYQSGPAAAGDQKKAKKKKKNPKPSAGGVLIVDEDPVWQKPVQIEEEEPSSGDEKPQVDEDIEVKRMRRMEVIRAVRPCNSIANDDSGWVTLPVPEPAGSGSPRCHRTTLRRLRGKAAPGGRRTSLPRGEGIGGTRHLLNVEVLRGVIFRRRGRGKGGVSPPRRRARVQEREAICHRHRSPGGKTIPLLQGGGLAMIPRNPRTSRHHGGARGTTQRSLRTALPLCAGHGMTRRSPKTSLHHEDGSARIRHSWTTCHLQEDKIWDRAWGMGIFLHQGRVGSLHHMIYLHLVRRDTSPRKVRKEGAPKETRRAGLMSAAEVKEDIRKIKD